MRRFSRKSKKYVENGTKEAASIRDDANKQTSAEKPRTNIIKGIRKRLQSARSPTAQHPKEENIYAMASAHGDIKDTNTIFNNNSTERQTPNCNLYQTAQSSSDVPREDPDYSRVSNDEDETTSPSSPGALNLSNERNGHVYSTVLTNSENETLPGQSVAEVPAQSSGEKNSNNSNHSGAILSIANGDSNAVQRPIRPVSHPLMQEFHRLAKKGWYWGPLSREQAEKKLRNLPEASFLVRDSSDDRYLLSLSFRSNSRTLHTRIEHSGIKFSFYEDNPTQSYTSVIELIENSVRDSNEQGVFCYSRSRHPNAQTFPVRLMHPVSRFTEVRPLQDLCRFVIRQYTRIDHIQSLPVPNQIKGYLNQSYF